MDLEIFEEKSVFSDKNIINKKIEFSKLPQNPGVYLFKDELKNIIYVGKAKNLKNRIKSYFLNNNLSSKTKVLMKNAKFLDFIISNNELEALLLENKLIKKYKPKYNILLKDSKTYPYIKISKERIPKLSITRKIDEEGIFFGPFPSKNLRDLLFKFLISYFGLITNKTYSSKSSIYFEILKAPALKENEIDENEYNKKVKEAIYFLKNKNSIQSYLKIIKDKMEYLANNKEFEKAIEFRNFYNLLLEISDLKEQVVDLVKNIDQNVVYYYENLETEKVIFVIVEVSKGIISSKKEYSFDYYEDVFYDFIKNYYSSNYIPDEIIINKKFWKDEEDLKLIELYFKKFKSSKVTFTIPKKGEKLKLLEIAKLNALDLGNNKILNILKDKLSLKRLPKIIDCFDISNFGNLAIVGAVIRFKDGDWDYNSFRKFKIKKKLISNDDYYSMKEVVFRRYFNIRQKKENIPYPDLIIIDGGKGHLNIAKLVLEDLGILGKVDLISIAKGEKRDKNEIYLLDKEDPIILDLNSKEEIFLRKIRDKTHNFVINYNRYRRKLDLEKEFDKNI
jgi:excinuclease ABC subunit C